VDERFSGRWGRATRRPCGSLIIRRKVKEDWIMFTQSMSEGRVFADAKFVIEFSNDVTV
jgi:hypothetical protein